MQNLHNRLRAALQSFKEACSDDASFTWNALRYAGRKWKVSMKFAIAYVVGNTVLQNQLCGWYGSCGEKVKQLCRYCNCLNEYSVSPSLHHKYKLWTPLDFHSKYDADYFQACLHHVIQNVFYNLEFGANKQNIHLATQGECLHMHQLGSAARGWIIQMFRDGNFFKFGWTWRT